MIHLTRPARGEPEGLLVLLHGRGADEHDLFPLLDYLDPERRLLGVTPRGPLSLPPGGAHWYALHRLGEPDPPTFAQTYAELVEWLDGFGFPPEATVIGGFSQGAVMSYALSLFEGRARPAALIALSGFIPRVPDFHLVLEPPFPEIAIGHGTPDTVIPVDWGRKARESLTDAGADVFYREYPLPHAVDPGFLEELVPWVRTALAGQDARSLGS